MKTAFRCMIAGVSILLIVTLASCGTVSEFKKASQQTGPVADGIEAKLGVRPFIGFNINNGVLHQLTVDFGASSLDSLGVGELKQTVRQVVDSLLDPPPTNVTICIRANQ